MKLFAYNFFCLFAILATSQVQGFNPEGKMVHKILKDMGLEKRPDMKHVNINAKEYALMYNVYQRSVMQTESFKELQRIKSESNIIAQNNFVIQPYVGSGRLKRSGFEETVVHKDKLSVILKFTNEDLLGTGDFANSLHFVEKAKLTMSLSNVNQNQSDQVLKFSIYQLMEESSMAPEAAIAMETLSWNLENTSFQSLSFDISEIVQSWLIEPNGNHGIRIDCDLCKQLGIDFSQKNVHLEVKVDSSDNQIAMSRRSSLSKENNLDSAPKALECPPTTDKKRPRCCRESMRVDFSKIRGFEFIEQPKVFDAFLCKGRCPPRFNTLNDHTLLQSIMHAKTKHSENRIHRPCCVGTSFQPLDILHVDEFDPTKLKVTHWKNVVVSDCGCV